MEVTFPSNKMKKSHFYFYIAAISLTVFEDLRKGLLSSK